MNGPLRFCMITNFYPPYHFGGDAFFVQALANELASRGHQVEVIHCKDAYRLLARHEPRSGYDDHPNVTVHGLESPLGWLSPLATQQTGRPWFKRKAIEEVLSRGFDVIHYHNIALVGGPQVLTLGRAIKLYTPHDFWLTCPTHSLLRYNREPCVQTGTAHSSVTVHGRVRLQPNGPGGDGEGGSAEASPSRCATPSRPAREPDVRSPCFACELSHGRPPQWWRHSGLLRSALRHVDRFLSHTRFAMEMHRARGFDLPMVHLPGFLPDMGPSKDGVGRGLVPRRPYFLFVGRLARIKGLQTVIPVFRRFPRASLLVAGQGDYEEPLRKLAAGSDNIRFLGPLRRDELRALYAGATALIVPSICYDMSPLVILEAFAHGTPVIARGIGGMREMLEDSGGGVLYDDEAALAEAMVWLLADSALRDELGRRGHAAYLHTWTPEAHLRRYFQIIGEVAAARNGGTRSRVAVPGVGSPRVPMPAPGRTTA